MIGRAAANRGQLVEPIGDGRGVLVRRGERIGIVRARLADDLRGGIVAAVGDSTLLCFGPGQSVHQDSSD